MNITSVADKNLLAYDSATSKWLNVVSITASQVSDFDTEVNNNSTVSSNTGFRTTPSGIITAGDNIAWTGNTLNVTIPTTLDKATYTEINTGTNDTKYVTPLGLASSNYLFESEIKAIKLDDFGTPDDNTDLDVSTTNHGLCPKAPNITTQFLKGDGTWDVPIGGPSYWEVITTPTRTANTTFTCTTTANTNIDKILSKGTVMRWEESSVIKAAVIETTSLASTTLTVTMKGDVMASIDSNTLNYSLTKAITLT